MGEAAMKPSDTEIRLHALNYGLLYPAFLGTFIFSLFSKGLAAQTPWWPHLFAGYFALQFMEAAADRDHYSWFKAAVDWVEIILMTLLFHMFGYFEPGTIVDAAQWPSPCINGVMAVVFGLPILGRTAPGRSQAKEYELFYRGLTVLSAAAAAVVLVSIGHLSLYLVAGLLGIYALAFQFANGPVSDWCPKLKRPPNSGN